MTSSASSHTRKQFSWLVLLAAGWTVVNALKPMHVDDPVYAYCARQVAVHPLDPYGFEIFWYEKPTPANHVMIPPVVPYWIAIAVRLFGEHSVAWKLWMFPFALLFVRGVHHLATRFAPGFEAELTLFVTLSPAFLPSLNMMLDIPALAIVLTALDIHLESFSRGGIFGTLAAGILSGLAIETKYTGLLAIAIIGLHSLLFRQWWRGIVCSLLAFGFFGAWEWFTYECYGESHFLHALLKPAIASMHRPAMILPLIFVLGSVGGPLVLLRAIVQKWSKSRQLLAVLGLIANFGLVAFVPLDWGTYHWQLGALKGGFTIYDIGNAVIGCLVLGSMFGSAWDLLRLPAAEAPRNRCFNTFLISWLVLELIGYFALSPFPAARRLLGILLVSALLLGRHLSLKDQSATLRNRVRGVVILNAALGVVFAGVDYLEAQAQKTAIADVKLRLEDQKVWFLGHWGFQYYAERSGMQQAIPGSTLLRAGEWLVVPDPPIDQPRADLQAPELVEQGSIEIVDRVPLRTLPGFYAGRLPVQRLDGPRLRVRVYQVHEDFVLQPKLGLVKNNP